MKYLFILCAVIFSSCTIMHRTTGKNKKPFLKSDVTGTFEDSAGYAIPNVTIIIARNGKRFTTGDSNKFLIPKVKNNITLYFFCIGYKPQSIYCSPGCNLKIRLKTDTEFDSQLIRNYYSCGSKCLN